VNIHQGKQRMSTIENKEEYQLAAQDETIADDTNTKTIQDTPAIQHADSDSDVEMNPTDRMTRADLVLDGDFVLKDRFGFFLTDEFHQEVSLSPEEKEKRRAKEISRTKKWIKMLKNWSKFFHEEKEVHDPKASVNKLKVRVRKGIPDMVRGYAWYQFIRVKEIQARVSFPNPYEIDTSVISQTTREEIDRDIDRTFPRHVMFVEDGGLGQTSLRRLLQWYAALDPEVGYCQGMGFIAGLFLTYMIEEQAFYAFYGVLTVSTCLSLSLFLSFSLFFSLFHVFNISLSLSVLVFP
jgi:hypothetical protein